MLFLHARYNIYIPSLPYVLYIQKGAPLLCHHLRAYLSNSLRNIPYRIQNQSENGEMRERRHRHRREVTADKIAPMRNEQDRKTVRLMSQISGRREVDQIIVNV